MERSRVAQRRLAVRGDGRAVTATLVAAARAKGATDLEIHDTVLVAAAFRMFNQTADGLATDASESPAEW